MSHLRDENGGRYLYHAYIVDTPSSFEITKNCSFGLRRQWYRSTELINDVHNASHITARLLLTAAQRRRRLMGPRAISDETESFIIFYDTLSAPKLFYRAMQQPRVWNKLLGRNRSSNSRSARFDWLTILFSADSCSEGRRKGGGGPARSRDKCLGDGGRHVRDLKQEAASERVELGRNAARMDNEWRIAASRRSSCFSWSGSSPQALDSAAGGNQDRKTIIGWYQMELTVITTSMPRLFHADSFVALPYVAWVVFDCHFMTEDFHRLVAHGERNVAPRIGPQMYWISLFTDSNYSYTGWWLLHCEDNLDVRTVVRWRSAACDNLDLRLSSRYKYTKNSQWRPP